MTTILKQKAEYIINQLEALYPETPIPLTHTNPYTLLIAVLLSAQCTDERVNKVTPLLFKVGNTPEAILKYSLEEIEKIIKPCGLSKRKSEAIYNLTRILIKDYQSSVPSDFESLESLPGVGHKTASVVMSQSFGIPAFPVDTHIHRLATRWKLTNGKNVVQTEKDLKRIFPKEKWNKLHLQIIFYGREFCSARGCNGTQCEICSILNCY